MPKLVEDDDRKWRKLLKGMERIGRGSISIGVHESESQRDDDGGLSNAELAAIHEFGTDKIHQRSFLEATFPGDGGPKGDAIMRKVAEMVGDGKSPDSALDIGAMLAEVEVKQTIIDGIEPGLADSTKAKRAKMAAGGKSARQRDVPLILTGRMLGSIKGKASVGGAARIAR